MDFMELAKARYTVRNYDGRPVEEEKLQEVLKAAQLAPTAKNQQPQKIYVLKSEEALAKIRGITRCAYNAPVVLMFAYDQAQEWVNPLEEGVTSGQQDVSITATHVMLRACELGLSTCWVNFFPPVKTAEAFALPEGEHIVLLMPLGYAAAGTAPLPTHEQTKTLDELVKYL